jgi:hypothetical protein
MCYAVKCPACGRTTWDGCGRHAGPPAGSGDGEGLMTARSGWGSACWADSSASAAGSVAAYVLTDTLFLS